MIPEQTGHAQIEPHRITPENALRLPFVEMPTADFTDMPHFAQRGSDSGSKPLRSPPCQRIIIARELPRRSYERARKSAERRDFSGGVALLVFSQGSPLRGSHAAALRGLTPLRAARVSHVSMAGDTLAIAHPFRVSGIACGFSRQRLTACKGFWKPPFRGLFLLLLLSIIAPPVRIVSRQPRLRTRSGMWRACRHHVR